jgi:hypothetical protein
LVWLNIVSDLTGNPLVVWDDATNTPSDGPTAIELTGDSKNEYLIGTSINRLECEKDEIMSLLV